MQGNKIIEAADKQAGFTLIELMIAVVLGLIITAAVTAMTVNNLKISGDTLKSARLNQDLGAVMQIMVNDIRRAGYSYCDKSDPNFVCPLDDGIEQSYITYATGEDIYIGDADDDDPPDDGDCILYSYNRNANQLIDINERNGFKLDAGGMKMRTSCDPGDDNCTTSCLDTAGNWVPLTDPDIIAVKSLTITTDSSKCNNIDEEISIRIKPGVSAAEFACNETTTGNIQQGAVDGNGDWAWSNLSGSTSLPFNASFSVGVRHVNISLEAELTKDSSVSKNLDVSIRVRNDHVYE